MKKYSKYIKCIIKYLILVIFIYNTTYKILRNTKIMSYSKQCNAIIFDLGTVPDFFGSKYVVFVAVDYYDNGRWYKTGDKYPDKESTFFNMPITYKFHEDESWMRKGDKIKIWVNKDDQYELHYINFKSMVIWTIITVLYSLFIVINIIVKRKRKKLTS